MRNPFHTSVVEIDRESIAFLKKSIPIYLFDEDFTQLDFPKLKLPLAVVGNFLYNISSQILFKILDEKEHVPEMVGMFQKEVAERVCSKPGTKAYGIISIFIQAYYDVEYLFTVDEHVFNPPPKVKSGVIKMIRNNVEQLPCDEKQFKQVVKTAFNQGEKRFGNSLKPLLKDVEIDPEILAKRSEQLEVKQFIALTQKIFD